MSAPLDYVHLGVYADDAVMMLGAKGVPGVAMAHLPGAPLDLAGHRGIGRRWGRQSATWAEWRPAQEIECAIHFAVDFFCWGYF